MTEEVAAHGAPCTPCVVYEAMQGTPMLPDVDGDMIPSSHGFRLDRHIMDVIPIIKDLALKCGTFKSPKTDQQARRPPIPFEMSAAFPWLEKWECPLGLRAEIREREVRGTVIRFMIDDFSHSAHAWRANAWKGWLHNFPGFHEAPRGMRCRFFVPTCQVKVVRFYQSCSPPWLAVLFFLLLLLLLLVLLVLLVLVLRLLLRQAFANAWPRSCPTPERTAGLEPGTCGPAKLSGPRWAPAWDLPSSVCTAGPQPGTCPVQCASVNFNGQIECQKICQIECEKICQVECQKICQIQCQKVC